MATRDLVSNPCEDACGTLVTGRTVEGAPVYLCPGCDTEWIDLDERTGADAPTPPEAPATAQAQSGTPAPTDTPDGPPPA